MYRLTSRLIIYRDIGEDSILHSLAEICRRFDKGDFDKEQLIGDIYDAVKQKNILDETLFIVSADHGGTPEGSHGGDTEAERYVFLGVAGPTVVIGGRIQNPEVRDIAAISAYALGLDFPETWTAAVTLFPLYTQFFRHILKLNVN